MNQDHFSQTTLDAAKRMLEDAKPNVAGDSTIVDGYWIETHTLGCRNAADEEEKTWWDGLWEFYDRYTTDGISLVLGDPTDGKFVSITPQKKLIGHSQSIRNQPEE